MKCPADGSILEMTSREGVEIDYCPSCRGVWLDRGELDKIIERSAPPPAPRHESRHHEDDRDHGGRHAPRRHKRESFLSELFDF